MRLKIFLYTLVIFGMVACAPNKKEVGEMTLSVGVMSSMDYLPIAVAQRRGYFGQEGIQVNIQKFYSANERDAALQSGNLDGSILDYTGVAIQAAGGVELFLTSQCDGTFELIAGKKTSITSSNELKGKSFAVARNTVIEFCTDIVLRNAGITQSEIVKSEINKIPLRLEMLRNGKIDLAVLPDPFATIAKSEGNPMITSLKDLGYRVTGIVFTKSAIEGKKKAIEAFYKAYNLAIKDLQEKPVSDFQEILVSEIGFPQALVATVKLPDYQPAKIPETKDLEVVNNWLKEKGLVTGTFDINTIVNSEFIPK